MANRTFEIEYGLLHYHDSNRYFYGSVRGKVSKGEYTSSSEHYLGVAMASVSGTTSSYPCGLIRFCIYASGSPSVGYETYYLGVEVSSQGVKSVFGADSSSGTCTQTTSLNDKEMYSGKYRIWV